MSGLDACTEAVNEATDAWYAANTRMLEALARLVTAIVREQYPDATHLLTLGDMEGSDFTQRLRATEVKAGGVVLADYDDQHTGGWDDLTDEIDPYLDWIADIEKDNVLGRVVFDLAEETRYREDS